MEKFSKKVQVFIDVYDGRIEPAADKAGLSYGYCRRIVTESNIIEAIQSRGKSETATRIATRQQRQEFWSDTMTNKDLEYKDRLRASELLGKSEADFTDKIEAVVKATVSSEPLSDEEWQNKYTGDKS